MNCILSDDVVPQCVSLSYFNVDTIVCFLLYAVFKKELFGFLA